MGLGSSEPQRRIYYLSPRSQDKDKKLYPHFKVQVRDTTGTKDQQDETSVSGYLLKIGHGQYEWPKDSGDIYPTIQVFLVDGDDLFKIEANVQSNIIRSLMNTIIGTRDFELMKIRLYAKNDNPNIYISNNDGKTTWKFDYEKDIKPLIEEYPDPKRPGKTIKVYHKVDSLLMKEWLELEPYISKRAHDLGYDKPPSGAKGVDTRPDADKVKNEVDNITQDELDKEDANFVPEGSADDLPF